MCCFWSTSTVLTFIIVSCNKQRETNSKILSELKFTRQCTSSRCVDPGDPVARRELIRRHSGSGPPATARLTAGAGTPKKRRLALVHVPWNYIRVHTNRISARRAGMDDDRKIGFVGGQGSIERRALYTRWQSTNSTNNKRDEY